MRELNTIELITSNRLYGWFEIRLAYQPADAFSRAKSAAISATLRAANESGEDRQATTKVRLGSFTLVLTGRNFPTAATLPRIAGGMTAIPMPSSAMRTTVASEALAWIVTGRPARSNRSRTTT